MGMGMTVIPRFRETPASTSLNDGDGVGMTTISRDWVGMGI